MPGIFPLTPDISNNIAIRAIMRHMHLRERIVQLLIVFLYMILLPGQACPSDILAQNEGIDRAAARPEPAGRFYNPPIIEPREGGGLLIYFPAGDLYPPYAADPVRMGLAVEPVTVTKVGIENTSNKRINLSAGAEMPFIRSQRGDQPDVGWQLTLVGGFNDQNDVGIHLDNIGWDGHYGLMVNIAPQSGLAFKLALLHISSHVGDEFAERTGRTRIGYTRQEAAAGISWIISKRWRIYSEAGDAFDLGNEELQKKWRTQHGLEYESGPWLWKGRIAWYAGVDVQRMQERNWHNDTAAQLGLVLRSLGRTVRVAVSLYNGRPPIGEFFQHTESYRSYGLWIDF